MKHAWLVLAIAFAGCETPENGPTPTPTPSPAPTYRSVTYSYGTDQVHCDAADEVAYRATPFGDTTTLECYWRCALWFDQPKQVRLRFDFTAGGDRIMIYGTETFPDTITECPVAAQAVAGLAN